MKVAASVFVVIGASIIFLWYFAFYDDVVRSGSKYGFTIGMSKSNAALSIIDNYGEEDYELVLTTHPGPADSSATIRISAKKIQSAPLEEMNIWRINLGGLGRNSLIIVFENGSLVEVHRFRRIWVP